MDDMITVLDLFSHSPTLSQCGDISCHKVSDDAMAIASEGSCSTAFDPSQDQQPVLVEGDALLHEPLADTGPRIDASFSRDTVDRDTREAPLHLLDALGDACASSFLDLASPVTDHSGCMDHQESASSPNHNYSPAKNSTSKAVTYSYSSSSSREPSLSRSLSPQSHGYSPTESRAEASYFWSLERAHLLDRIRELEEDRENDVALYSLQKTEMCETKALKDFDMFFSLSSSLHLQAELELDGLRRENVSLKSSLECSRQLAQSLGKKNLDLVIRVSEMAGTIQVLETEKKKLADSRSRAKFVLSDGLRRLAKLQTLKGNISGSSAGSLDLSRGSVDGKACKPVSMLASSVRAELSKEQLSHSREQSTSSSSYGLAQQPSSPFSSIFSAVSKSRSAKRSSLPVPVRVSMPPSLHCTNPYLPVTRQFTNASPALSTSTDLFPIHHGSPRTGTCSPRSQLSLPSGAHSSPNYLVHVTKCLDESSEDDMAYEDASQMLRKSGSGGSDSLSFNEGEFAQPYSSDAGPKAYQESVISETEAEAGSATSSPSVELAGRTASPISTFCGTPKMGAPSVEFPRMVVPGSPSPDFFASLLDHGEEEGEYRTNGMEGLMHF